jgi:hypothetical protein
MITVTSSIGIIILAFNTQVQLIYKAMIFGFLSFSCIFSLYLAVEETAQKFFSEILNQKYIEIVQSRSLINANSLFSIFKPITTDSFTISFHTNIRFEEDSLKYLNSINQELVVKETENYEWNILKYKVEGDSYPTLEIKREA